MVAVSMQRYVFIFHKSLLNTRFKHYVPILLPPVLFVIWYVVLICFYPCQQQFDYRQLWCSGACYGYQGLISSIDWIISSLLPVSISIVFNILLLIQVVYRKYKMQHARTWRTARKLIIQLLPISCLFFSIYVPVNILVLIRLWFDPSLLLDFYMNIFAYFNYFGPLLVPFVSLIGIPEIMTRMKRCNCCGNIRRPQPIQQFPLTPFTGRVLQQRH